jgi:hypothetical protein
MLVIGSSLDRHFTDELASQVFAGVQSPERPSRPTRASARKRA